MPTGVYARPPATSRFWAKVDVTDGCWFWQAATSLGYGLFFPEHSIRVLAHRFAYETLIGPIPPTLQLDHLCRNRRCVNPDHLEPVTIQVNILRGEGHAAKNAAKTHCPQGHAYDLFNTHHFDGERHCRLCGKERQRKYREHLKAKGAEKRVLPIRIEISS